MKIDPKTLLFTDIPPEMAKEMLAVSEDIMFKGTLPHPRPEWLQEWMQAGGFDERQYLLIVSTVLPARVLLSIIKHLEVLSIQDMEG